MCFLMLNVYNSNNKFVTTDTEDDVIETYIISMLYINIISTNT